MPTVKEGQHWTNDWIKGRAERLGLDIKTYWRQPANGIDWHLELNAQDAKVMVPIWFLYLKRLDGESQSKIKEVVSQGLEQLEKELQVGA